MVKIGLFYGSDTGNTEEVAEQMVNKIGEDLIIMKDIENAEKSDIEAYNFLILGTSTWYDGELQSSWEDFLHNLDEIDFTGKTVALFGLGDQFTYGEFFVDGIGIIYDKIIKNGAKVVGHWPTDDYDYEESVGERDGKFVGLALDNDNEFEKTDDRIHNWLELISTDFKFNL